MLYVTHRCIKICIKTVQLLQIQILASMHVWPSESFFLYCLCFCRLNMVSLRNSAFITVPERSLHCHLHVHLSAVVKTARWGEMKGSLHTKKISAASALILQQNGCIQRVSRLPETNLTWAVHVSDILLLLTPGEIIWRQSVLYLNCAPPQDFCVHFS